MENIAFSGYMIAVMVMMESPSIIVGVILLSVFGKEGCETKASSCLSIIRHSLTNGSVLLILGSLFVGFMASEQQAEGIKPFTTNYNLRS